jgi:hypothetical protein
VVNPRAMHRAISALRNRRTTSSERAKLLSAFDRSGLSAAAFAREHQIHYTTFCGWRQRREKARAPEFIEVERLEPGVSSDLLVELGAKIRLRISSSDQVPLAAALLACLAQEEAC